MLHIMSNWDIRECDIPFWTIDYLQSIQGNVSSGFVWFYCHNVTTSYDNKMVHLDTAAALWVQLFQALFGGTTDVCGAAHVWNIWGCNWGYLYNVVPPR